MSAAADTRSPTLTSCPEATVGDVAYHWLAPPVAVSSSDLAPSVGHCGAMFGSNPNAWSCITESVVPTSADSAIGWKWTSTLPPDGGSRAVTTRIWPRFSADRNRSPALMPAALAVVVWNWAGFAGVALGVNGPHGVLGANTTAVETDTAPLTPVNPCTVLSSNDQWSLVSLNSGTLSMACSLAS